MEGEGKEGSGGQDGGGRVVTMDRADMVRSTSSSIKEGSTVIPRRIEEQGSPRPKACEPRSGSGGWKEEKRREERREGEGGVEGWRGGGQEKTRLQASRHRIKQGKEEKPAMAYHPVQSHGLPGWYCR